ncbi:amidotransferase 1, exosortase A system-associated [Luteimonas vadosa]|uniref:asparagine synthase (glutamine-hydrolyzing) n=2 Tax=Luteimonas vadosa TaxID=1165507 RepID=A0ABP9DQB0_9GAMM
MCGIGGYFGRRDRDAGQHLLDAMQRVMLHRGPDGQGTWIDPRQCAGLAHVRLAILDPRPAGAQPMATGDGRYVISYNGEVYNFQELRVELEALGVSFHTGTDTEVILHAFRQWGTAALSRLRGMFALAIWDTEESRGWLARDGFGIKPLYYAATRGGLVFGSELRVVLEAGVPIVLDPASVAGFFATGSVPEPGTLIQGVEMLPPGQVLAWSEEGCHTQRFWEPVFPPPAPMGHLDAVQLASNALEDSVRAHFVSDVPVGLFLSGGIDSTALLALSARLGLADQLAAFSIAVDDAAADESAVAARTAKRFGAHHHVHKLDARAARESFPEFLDAMDVPSVDGFNTWTVSRFAHDNGFKVVLSGLGGDELFGGYPSFQRVPRLHAATRLISGIPMAGATMRHLAKLRRLPPRWRRAVDAVVAGGTLAASYRAYRGIFSLPEAVQLAAHYCGMDTNDVLRGGWPQETAVQGTGAQAISQLELTRYMRNQLLRDSDVMSMSHGLELRLPLVDRTLFDTMATVPAALRLQPGKGLLRQAVPELPAEVLNAPKRGFSFPVRKWLEQDFGAGFREVGKGLPVVAEEWYQKWSLMTFERWRAARL